MPVRMALELLRQQAAKHDAEASKLRDIIHEQQQLLREMKATFLGDDDSDSSGAIPVMH
jgi:hypothetical protein